tara:strand:+ start:181 stop:606 length:426 start_codon:yes stop_codon:yes gene_type:complete
MGLLSTITSAAGTLLGGDTLKDVGGIIDNLHTSGEEKAAAKERITEILAKAEQAAQAQVSARWEADMKHGSWLSKNIRPLTLIFLTAIFTVLSIFDGNLQIAGQDFTIGPAYVPVYQTLLMTVYAAYFAGRSIEKVKQVAR